MKVRALQNDTVDQLCWRHYGKTAGVTEKVLEANPGLSNQIFLNAGQEIEMPVITSEVERVTVQLWECLWIVLTNILRLQHPPW